MQELFDLAIIGGGINGCGIARDAQGRGLKVFLCEKGDLASATSAASTKLIHGGLRYLEYYEFRLVREALMERERLLAAAPHIIWPLRFVLPHQKGLRPRWLIRLGLFLYDHLGGRKILPGTRSLNLASHAAGKPLKEHLRRAFEYSDCWVEDARLVALNAMDAAERGAEIATRTRCLSARRVGGQWQLEVEGPGGEKRTIQARALINAAGPWVSEVLTNVGGSNSGAKVRLVKGSHLVVKKLFEHDRAYIFQNGDGRIIFAIPYERDFTLIGTTDVDHKGEPTAPPISAEETDYLIAAANEYFRQPITKADIVWSYAGVRPLYDDGAKAAKAATRDYVLELDVKDGLPLLSVFGGKITTYRRLAESALAKLSSFFPAAKGEWTAGTTLPGGDFPIGGEGKLADELASKASFLPRALLQRWVRAYGTRARELVKGLESMAGLGRHFGADLYEREVRYLMDREWARGADDILWRRSKLGLRMTAEQRQQLEDFLRQEAA